MVPNEAVDLPSFPEVTATYNNNYIKSSLFFDYFCGFLTIKRVQFGY